MTTTDARKRNHENKIAERLCRGLHPLEWRNDNQGRTTACSTCQQAATWLGEYTTNPNGCIDPEDYARIYNEGYNTAARHAHQGIAGLTRTEITGELETATSTTVVRLADVTAVLPTPDSPE